MKNYIIKISLLFITIAFIGCSVDNFEPEGVLSSKNVIKDESTAELALNGIYISSRPNINGLEPLLRSLMMYGVEHNPGSFAGPEAKLFFDNNVKPTPIDSRGGTLFTFYIKSHTTINLANFFVKKLEGGIPGITEAKKNQMISEAKVLRANAYFMLLKVFGQFYDSSSSYGVVATTQVVDGFTELPRNSVEDSYKLIISDLEFALNNLSATKNRYYVTKTFAESLLAKVLMYKGGSDNFGKAKTHCENIINNLGGEFNLEGTYKEIFSQGINSKEVIFAPYYKIGADEENTINFLSDYLSPSEYFANLADEIAPDSVQLVQVIDSTTCEEYQGELFCDYKYDADGNPIYMETRLTVYEPRYQYNYITQNPKNQLGSFNKYLNYDSPFYIMRVAEIYLMYAELQARIGNETEALRALNTIRKRAGLEEKSFSNKATLLEDIRLEKLFELNAEMAEPWFDLVRYDRLGDLSVSKVKPTLSSTDKLIFPIPLPTLANNSKFGKQNPGY